MRRHAHLIVTTGLLLAVGFIASQAQNPVVRSPASSTATYQGNASKFQMASGVPVSGDCATFDASLNITGPGTGAGCGGSGTSGGGILAYSNLAGVGLTGTLFFPVGGGASASATETNVDADLQSSTTISRFGANLSAALGTGNSVVFTWRKNAADTVLTCTISGASATSCGDSTHSFSIVPGDLVAIKAVFTGTIVVAPVFVMATQTGTLLSGSVNSGTTGQFGYYAANGTAISGTSSGDVTISSGATVLGNIPNATPMAGSLLATNIAAPGTPASGKTSVYIDSTQKLLSDKNDAAVVHHTVATSACSGGTPVVGNINADGSVTCAAGGSSGAATESHAASNSAELDFTTCITSGSRNYRIIIDSIIAASNNVDLQMQFSTDGGATYIAANYNWGAVGYTPGGSGGTGNAGVAAIVLAFRMDNTANWSMSGTFELFNPLNASIYKQIVGTMTEFSNANAAIEGFSTTGVYTGATTAVNAFRVKASSGNLTSGTVACYALPN